MSRERKKNITDFSPTMTWTECEDMAKLTWVFLAIPLKLQGLVEPCSFLFFKTFGGMKTEGWIAEKKN